MNKILFANISVKDFLVSVLPITVVILMLITLGYKHLDPAPPNHFVMATGEDEGDYQLYAQQYKEILKKDGVDLQIKSSHGPLENLKFLQDESSGVDAGFAQDGIGSNEDEPDLVSLGSLYYEPIWIFYRGNAPITKFSQLRGKKIGVGREGRGTHILAFRLLKESGILSSNSEFVMSGGAEAAKSLVAGELDAAFFILAPEDPLVQELAKNEQIHLMSLDQAEAISRQMPFLHHLVLPHGVFDLQKNIPDHDIDLVSPTATLLVRDDLHPALVYLLLKAAVKVHSVSGIFEKKNEFPMNKDDQFPLSEDALQFYKSGGPFWQRYLPFWLAAWIDRFILIVIPFLAIAIPLMKMVPQVYKWRIRKRIYQRYGELKYLETQLENKMQNPQEVLEKLDAIEARVNKIKVPLEFTEHIYSLRGHIHFVRERLKS
jgi:TRAP transporter TAXI family solute receptor